MHHKKYKKILFSSLIVAMCICGIGTVYAQEVEHYNEESSVVDSDLDGLTNEEEEQLFGTDISNPDTDDDGIFDGIEVLYGVNPLDVNDPFVTQLGDTVSDTMGEQDPLAWYFSRATGIIAYVLLWFVIFFGLSFRNPLLKKIVAPLYKLDMHIYLSLLALAFVFVHGCVLVFDEFVHLSLLDVFIPFFTDTDVIDGVAIAWGIIALYILIILIITSLLRGKIPLKAWRWLHFLHVAVFVLVVVHVLAIGTDFQGGPIQMIFFASVGILGFFYLVSLSEVIIRLSKK